MFLVASLIGIIVLVWFVIFRDKITVKEALEEEDSGYPDDKNK